jgi:hypothetical protein
MIMTPNFRKFALTAHVTFSVGWLGSVVTYLALVVIALTNTDIKTIHAFIIAMESIGWYVIVPLAFASLLTGLVMSLGTPWGLFRHYWILFKLLLTTVATIVLLVNMPNVSFLAGVVTETDKAYIGGLQGQLLHSGGGLLVLLLTTILSVYKPRGLTRYGHRKQHQQRGESQL